MSWQWQDDGGIILFGVDESNDYEECGVYDVNDIQKQINNQCLQMHPKVRPILTVVEKEGKYFVAAEIPSIDIAEIPCYYEGVGRLKGSYIRVGDSDEHMTEYEIYSFEAFRQKYQDDIRVISRASEQYINTKLLKEFKVERGTFVTVLYNSNRQEKYIELINNIHGKEKGDAFVQATFGTGKSLNSIAQFNAQFRLLQFLEVERTRKEIAEFVGMDSVSYALKKYIEPLVEEGKVEMTIPDKPKSKKQRYRIKLAHNDV